jgi:hypothetical protein
MYAIKCYKLRYVHAMLQLLWPYAPGNSAHPQSHPSPNTPSFSPLFFGAVS